MTPRAPTPATSLGECSFRLDACLALFDLRVGERAVAYRAIEAAVTFGIGMALGVEVVRQRSA